MNKRFRFEHQDWGAVAMATLGAALALVLGTACELTPGEQGTVDGAFDGPGSSDYDDPAGLPGPMCVNERFVQPEAVITRKIDLLFVVDTSGSIGDERGQIAEGIDAFVAALPSPVDYRIAVMLAHGSRSEFSGNLWQKAGHGPVLDSRTMSLQTVRSELRYLLTHVNEDPHSDGGEEGFYSYLRSLDGPSGKLASARAAGFYRQDAALAVVFVSDENDICAQYPAGVTPVVDTQGIEPQARARDCADITVDRVLQSTRSLQGTRPYLFGAIVYNNPVTIPARDENEFGYGYMDLVVASRGVSVDMAGTHYTSGLSEIGSLASVKLDLIADFTLTRPGVDPMSIDVFVDGVATDYTYTSATNEVHVSEPGVARSVVDINYCLKATPPAPEPTPEPVPPDCDSGPGCAGGGVIGV